MLFFLVSLLASIAGAICGIGGGVVIKPVLDLLQLENVSTVSFLSGCTVLSMSLYSVGKSLVSREHLVKMDTGTPLAIGAALGGVAGKQMFSAIKALFADPNTVGSVQAWCLAAVTMMTLLYTLNKAKITGHQVKHPLACVGIGLILGVMSSFLGIGGGPVNLVVLYYFFGMDTKTAAANSLYIILFSQIASLLATLFTTSVPDFEMANLLWMVTGGISGGIAGRWLNKRMDNGAVEKLFIGLMALIVCISIFNGIRYA